jgi:hypothetical protein
MLSSNIMIVKLKSKLFDRLRATASDDFTLTVDFPDIFLCLLSKQRSVSMSKWLGATFDQTTDS